MGDDSLLSSQPHSREMARSNQMRQGGGSVDMLGESLLNVSIKEKFEIDLEDYRNKVKYGRAISVVVIAQLFYIATLSTNG